MKYAKKGSSSTADPLSSRGSCKAKFWLMEGLYTRLVLRSLINQLWRLRLKFQNIAGYKLEAAIEHFSVDVSGKVALDSGLSTGGFTDCLLQYGASFVYGVDVGYGQVADKIRRDERVSVIERTNLRYLSELPELVDLVTLDLSFISILLVMPAVINVMKKESMLVTLVKPQFEARRSQVASRGIVRDPNVHQEVLEKIIKGVEKFGFCNMGWIESPLKGADGNIEFLACFQRTRENQQTDNVLPGVNSEDARERAEVCDNSNVASCLEVENDGTA